MTLEGPKAKLKLEPSVTFRCRLANKFFWIAQVVSLFLITSKNTILTRLLLISLVD